MPQLPELSIAIVGMAGRFPDAKDIHAFWRNLANGKKSIRFFSDSELLAAGVASELLGERNFVKAGTLLEGVDQFDAAFFGFTPREAEIVDPQARLFLECAWEALEDAGWDPARHKGPIGVFAGKAFPFYWLRNVLANPQLVELMGELQVAVSSERDALAPLVSYKCDLTGPSISVQTFCSTSLAAVHLACQSLLALECDAALAGGVAVETPMGVGYSYQEGGILSPDGECRALDAQANGSVIGNGLGVVMLKRLEDAVRDGDHVYALIRGSAVGNDGMSRAGFSAPSVNGQAAVIAVALGTAGVEPDSIGYIETHGTGTPLGDAVELAAMKKVFGQGTDRKQFCGIGSLKPNIGHLDRASGVASLIKVALALHNKQIPPSLNFTAAHPDVDLCNSPFYVNTGLCAWTQGREGREPRRAGVSSFGLGGTNVHAILEEAPCAPPSDPARPHALLLLSAKSEAALEIAASNMAAHLEREQTCNLADVAYTLQVGRGEFNHRRMVVCATCKDAADALSKCDPARVFSSHQRRRDRPVAFLFPGVGDHYENMGRELYETEPVYRGAVDRCLDLAGTELGCRLRNALCAATKSTPLVHSTEGRLARLVRTDAAADGLPLHDTLLAQPAIFIVGYALSQLLISWGIRPRAVIGYSLGEYVAACIADVLSLEDALQLVMQRARLIQRLDPGAMVAVTLPQRELEAMLPSELAIAGVLTPTACVVAGPVEPMKTFGEVLRTRDIVHRWLPTSHAFHSPMMLPVVPEFTELLRTVTFHSPRVPLLSNVTGRWLTEPEAHDPTYWVRHLSGAVRFSPSVDLMLEDAHVALLEVGPGRALGSFIKQHPACNRERAEVVLSTLPHSNEQERADVSLLTALGRLWLAGVSIDWDSFYRGQRRHRVSLPRYPFMRQRYWVSADEALGKSVPNARAGRAPAAKKPDVADWFYRSVWRKAPLPARPAADLRGTTCLLFQDEGGLGELVADTLARTGAPTVTVSAGPAFARADDRRFVIRPQERSDYGALVRTLVQSDLTPQKIIHLRSVTRPGEFVPGTPDAYAEAQRTGFYNLLFLAQAISEHNVNDPIELFAFSSNGQPVLDDDELHPEKATLFGICRSILQEAITVKCRTIDFGVRTGDAWPRAEAVQHVIAELSSTATDLEAAYRSGERYVRAFEPQRLDATDTPPVRRAGVYLITGGFGGVGMLLAEHLGRNYQARLALCGRSSFPDRRDWPRWLSEHPDGDPVSDKIRALTAIEAGGGEVLLLRADVADERQMRQAVENAIRHYGALHGVVHAAGVSAPDAFGALQDFAPEKCDRHFRPKAHGLYVLHEVLAGRAIDFCLLFSSVSSILGGLGFAGYTAANTFVDAFTHWHNRTSATPWLSVDWDVWQVRAGDHETTRSTVAAYAMTPSEAAQAFERVLMHREAGQLVNSTGDLQNRLRQWILLEGLHPAGSPQPASATLRPPLETDHVAATTEYERRVIGIWQRLLGIDEIGIHDNFFDLGGNSLLGLQVSAALKKEFGLQVPAVALFEAPTISALARYLCPAPPPMEDDRRRTLGDRRLRARRGRLPGGIAIIGMACRVPGADNPDEFWTNLRDGVESVTLFSDAELLQSGVAAATLGNPDYVKARPILKQDVALFDAGFFGYSPREAELMDPQHRLFLECAWNALESAGYNAKAYPGEIGIIGGANLSTYLLNLVSKPDFICSLGQYEAGYQISIGTDKDSLATGVSYKLDLKGPSLSVQTFCSTSLVAVHLAAQSLLSGECDMALAGGVSIRVPVRTGYMHVEGGMESADGHCRSFDAKASGTTFGDGVGIVVLKRLEEALEDGDTIHAVIKGSVINNDGSLKVGYSAPSVDGQVEAVARALAAAGVTGEEIDYVEAHGTATRLGDPIEIAALTKAFRRTTKRSGFCAIGSAKSNFGHLDRAAGVTGLIKTVLALEHGLIPPSLHFEQPNPEISFETSPFYVNTRLAPWPKRGRPRLAGVNSLGMGGTNVHVVVEEAPEPAPTSPPRPWQLITISARTDTALQQATQDLADHLRRCADVDLADIVYTLQVGRAPFEFRRMAVCQSATDALAVFEGMDPRRVHTRQVGQGSNALVAFMFSGIGDQYPGLAQQLYTAEKPFRVVVDYCADLLTPILGVDLRQALFDVADATVKPSGIFARTSRCGLDKSRARLNRTEIAQPAVFVIEYALSQLLLGWGIRPSALAGYSLGEYVAACLSGVFSLEDALTLVARRAKLIQELPEGRMLAVSGPEEIVRSVLESGVALAVVTGPGTFVLAGPPDAMALAADRLAQREVSHRFLDTSHALHSHMMAPIAAELSTLVAGMQLHSPRIPFLSNVTGQWITAEQAVDPRYWAEHLTRTVQFDSNLAHLLGDESRVLLEIGPGQSLASFAKLHPACSRRQVDRIFSTLPPAFDRQPDLPFLLQAVGRLWLAGCPVDWERFYAEERRRRVPLPTYPFERRRYWIETADQSVFASSPTSHSGKKPDVADWFYRPSWQSAGLSGARATPAGPWAIFDNSTGLGARVISALGLPPDAAAVIRPGERFARSLDGSYTVRPDHPGDYHDLVEALRSAGRFPTRILHLWSLDGRAGLRPSVEAFRRVQQTGFYSLLCLAQAIIRAQAGDGVHITVVTGNAQPVGSEILAHENAPILGLCRVLPQEYRYIHCRAIDIVPPGSGEEEAALAARLADEMRAATSERSIAWRGQSRYVESFTPERLPGVPSQTPLRLGGVYLLTGGLGGIGLTLAEHFAETLRAKLVLVGRSGLPEQTEWAAWLDRHAEDDPTSSRIRKVEKLEKLGAEVLVMAADIADEAAMRRVIDTACARFGGLNGVIHGAGIVSGSAHFKSVQDITRSVCEAHFHAKVYGLYTLDKVLGERELDFCVLLSSLSSILGGLGGAGYVAANAVLDRYAHASSRGTGRRWTAVNWDTWQVGAHAPDVSVNTTVSEFSMTPQEGVQAFRRALAAGAVQMVHSTGDLHARYRQWILLHPGPMDRKPARSTYARPALATNYVPATAKQHKQIASIWQQVLGIEDIGVHDNFFDLGGNSLIGLDVIAEIRRQLNVQISPIALFEAPTISALAKYLKGGAAESEPEEDPLAARREAARHKPGGRGIAVIGMSGRFPGAKGVSKFWENLCGGVESITLFTDRELLEAGMDPAELQAPNYVRARPIIDDIDQFDAGLFGYSPRDIGYVDPQHRLFLECAWEALEQAGYHPQSYPGLIGVFGGASLSAYMINWFVDPELSRAISDYQAMISGDRDSLTTTVSYKLNLRGPSFAVQTFCSTSLVAVHLACQSLLNGECDMALAGGVSITVPQKRGYTYQEGGMESPDGHCRTFDAKAQGTLFGDGVGIVMLKRLDDALADGDMIEAVIRGTAINNDGSLKVGYTAPSVVGQAEAVRAALERSGVDPETIGYIEAHGTATALGDPIEVASLTRAFRRHTDKRAFCGLGSVKPNVGHLDRAAGVTGLIKAVLAVKHGFIPPTLHFQAPNPEIDFAASPFYVVDRPTPWPQQNGTPRRAGVNSLGMGGTNAHVIIEQAPPADSSGPSRRTQLLVLSAHTSTALEMATFNLACYLRAHPDCDLADVAYTLQVGRRAFQHRRMLVARTVDEALTVLEAGNPQRLSGHSCTGGDRPLAFLFPGVGEHYLQMGRELYETEPRFRDVFDECSDLFARYLGCDLRQMVFPPEEDERADRGTPGGSAGNGLDLFRSLLDGSRQAVSAAEAKLHDTAVAQPAVFAVEYALAHLLMSWGLRPQSVAGYSLGEYTAACLAGIFSLEDAIKLVAERARMIARLPQGKMLAASLPVEEVRPLLGHELSLAAHSGPNTCVLSGPSAAIDRLAGKLAADEISCRELRTSHAFHSRMMDPLSEPLTELARSIRLEPPRIPCLSNVTGTWMTADLATDPAYWARHMCQTVQFSECLHRLLEEEGQILLEVGPGQSLASFAKLHPACEPERRPLILNTLPPAHDRQPAGAFLLETLGRLWTVGARPDWDGFYGSERRRRVRLPTYPFERQSYWVQPERSPFFKHIDRRGVRSSRPSAETETPREPFENWFYVPSWKQSAPRPASAGKMATRLLFVGSHDISAQLTHRLSADGQRVVTVQAGSGMDRIDMHHYVIRPGRREDYDELVASLKRDGLVPEKIVHLWNASAPAQCACSLADLDLDRGFFSLMSLAQALGEADMAACQLSVVASDAHIVTGSERVRAEHAALIGPCNVIPQEYPRIFARLIDVSMAVENSWLWRALCSNLYNEVCSDHFVDRVVALRGHQRWTRSFERQPLPPATDRAPSLLRHDGVYMITGGLGGIGLAVAEGLVKAGDPKLVLVGRTPLPARDQRAGADDGQTGERGSGSRLARLQRLKELGADVLVVTADVSDPAQAHAAVREAIGHFGKLNGVFHLAGVPGEGLIQLKTAERSSQVLAPKVQGTLALEHALQHCSLDFLVLFSSVSAVTGGGPGQIEYSAANAFLDAHAAAHIGQERATISIGWNEWQWNAWEAGLDGFSPALRDRFRANRKKYGITFEEGIQALYQAMETRLPHVVVSPVEFNAVIAASRDFTVEAVARFGPVREAARPRYPRPPMSSSYLAPRSVMEEKIADLWGEILGIAEVGIFDNFFDLGGNSLVGMDMVARLKKDLGVAKIPAHVIYEAPTVSELAKYLGQDRDKHRIGFEERLSRGARRRDAVAERERERRVT